MIHHWMTGRTFFKETEIMNKAYNNNKFTTSIVSATKG